jgi:hypothetical protein
MFLLVFWGWLFGQRQSVPYPIFAFGTIILLLGVFAKRLSALGAWYFDTPRDTFTIAVTTQGFSISYDGTSMDRIWDAFDQLHESDKVILLHDRKYKAFLALPKRFFPEDRIGEVRGLLEWKMAEHKELAQ